MGLATRRAGDGLEWRTCEVQERGASFAVGGEGLPVVFLHGWGLGHRAYQHALRELVRRGCRVYAPALPGFGGTADLPSRQRTVEGYAAWVDGFIETIGIGRPALVVGHSFGGGVAIRLAHDFPARVRHLVLINSVGHPAGSTGPALVARPAERPPWEYGLHFAKELFFTRDGYRTIRAMSEDLIWNMVANPGGPRRDRHAGSAGRPDRRAGRTAPARGRRARAVERRRRRAPAGIASTPCARPSGPMAPCCAAGTRGSWRTPGPSARCWRTSSACRRPITRRTACGRRRPNCGRCCGARRSRRAVVTRLLTAASPLWMMSERPSVLAADLALCHPSLAAGEVRAVARPMEDPSTFRLTVVAADRRRSPCGHRRRARRRGPDGAVGVRGDVAGTGRRPALGHGPVDDVDGTRLGRPRGGIALGRPRRRLRRPRYAPTGRATVSTAESGPHRTLVKVTAPDRLGLLETVSRWFAERDISIEAAEITTLEGIATDRFLVDGEFEPAELADHLSRPAGIAVAALATESLRAARRPRCAPEDGRAARRRPAAPFLTRPLSAVPGQAARRCVTRKPARPATSTHASTRLGTKSSGAVVQALCPPSTTRRVAPGIARARASCRRCGTMSSSRVATTAVGSGVSRIHDRESKRRVSRPASTIRVQSCPAISSNPHHDDRRMVPHPRHAAIAARAIGRLRSARRERTHPSPVRTARARVVCR